MRQLTDHVLALLTEYNYDLRLAKQFIYDPREELDNMQGSEDIADDSSIEVIKGLYHRYPSKVLVFPTEACFGDCRFCFRKHIRKDTALSDDEFNRIVEYITSTPTVDEVIFSGGDPMVIENKKLFEMIDKIRAIPTVHIIRIHTRVLTYAPERIDNEFIEYIKLNQPIFLVFHINSVLELSKIAREKATGLIQNGILCFSQTALLHEINDTTKDLKDLFEELIRIRIKPYYLFHPDMVKGNDHFYVSIEKGVSLYKSLFNHISGLAMPIYLLNIPGGGGHCIMDLNNLYRDKDGFFHVIDWENKAHIFKEPTL
jgi:KamA family protein